MDNLNWIILRDEVNILVKVSIAAKKPQPNSKLGRKEFIWLPVTYCCSFLKEIRTRTQTGQNPGGTS